MVDEGEPEDGTDIQVTPPEEETAVPRSGAMKVLDRPTEVVHRLRRRYRRLNRRDKFAVLLAVLAIVMFLVIMSIWSTGGGIGGPDIGPEVRPPSDWNVDALEAVQLSGDEENTNLEGQETPYLVPLNPAPGEIYFVTSLSCQVDWTDESTPPDKPQMTRASPICCRQCSIVSLAKSPIFHVPWHPQTFIRKLRRTVLPSGVWVTSG